MPRPVMLAGLLGAAVGVPYVVDQSPEWRQQWSAADSAATDGQSGALPTDGQWLTPPELPTPEGPGAHLYHSPAPLEGAPTHSLEEVLRLDVTKDWVYSRWARKSTGLAEVDLFGVRVPLVSGTRMTDVAGSLTYYFNVDGKVDKIRLRGKTADTTELVNLLVRRYSFQPARPEVAGQQLYRVERRGRVESELRTWPESVLWATSPHTSFSVDLELNRPESGQFVEREPLPLAAIDRPPSTPPSPLDQHRPGKPILPVETLVPSTEGGQPGEAPSSPASDGGGGSPAKKVPKSPLRWPN